MVNFLYIFFSLKLCEINWPTENIDLQYWPDTDTEY